MDFLQNMNKAIDYIEDNLEGTIDHGKLSSIALSPAGNFQRFFTYAAGLPLSEYIRKRKLTRAAVDLQRSEARIMDIAIKYGYESQASFTRAFQAMHGVSPKQAKDGQPVKAYSKLHFHFSIRGDEALNYKVIQKPAFNMTGVKHTISKDEYDGGAVMVDLWNSLKKQRREISALSSEPDGFVYGVTMYNDDDSFDYYVASITDAADSDDSEDNNSFKQLTVPASKWAIFKCAGPLPDSQVNTWRQIFTDWLPFSGFSLANIPEIEWYSDGDVYSDDYESEIWIPVD